jgi:hypothetical protein
VPVDAAPFELPERLVTLVLDESTSLEGLELEVNLAVGMAVLRRVDVVMAALTDKSRDDRAALFDEMVALFATEGLRSWNMRRRGTDVPPTAEGLESIDPTLVGEIVGTWAGILGTVPPPLSDGSPSSEPDSGTPRIRVRRRRPSSR